MRKLKKSMVSCMLAAAMVVPCAVQMIAPLSASASVITPVSGSAFQYEVITKELSRTGNVSKVKLTIRFLNNPGINIIGMNVIPGDGCVLTKAEDVKNPDFRTAHVVYGNNVRFGYMQGNASTTNYEFSAYYTINNISENNQIRVEIDEYRSDEEGVIQSSFSEASHVTVPVTTSSQMVLGDTNGNNIIEQVDAYNTMCAVNNYSGKLSVNYLRTVKNLGTWQNLLPQLKFAEAMDVNFDGYITKEDYTDILYYNSYESLGEPLTNSPIGKVYYVNL